MKRKFLIYILTVFITVYIYNCNKNTTGPNPNLPPETTLANVPVKSDTLFSLVELHWDGGDSDGYIEGYEIRYTAYYTTTQDSTVYDWTFTTDTDSTIAFDSADPITKQRFQVRAVDEDGAVDPTPASKTFYTRQAYPPTVNINQPPDGKEFFVLDQTTDWWEGIFLKYEGFDPDGEIVEFGWSVDGSDWHWTGTKGKTSFFIKPDDFAKPLEGKHEIRVTARDNTNIVDENGYAVTIKLVKPTFQKDILIIDETDEEQLPSSLDMTDSEIDSFYSSIFGSNYEWDYKYYELRDRPMPPLDTLGQYKMVIWHADHRPSQHPHALPSHTDVMSDYMNVGGDFIMSGWRILKSFAWDLDFPVYFDNSSFVNEYLHIVVADETPYIPGDFIGARGVLGDINDVDIDTTKLDKFPFSGKLSMVNTIDERAGFTDVLYRYKNLPSSDLLEYGGDACGLKYNGTVFNAVILGFPMVFLEGEDAKSMGSDLLQIMGY